mgnify:CR=1 FL=1
MKNFFIKEEFSFFVLLYTFIKKDTILTLIYIVMKISHIEHLGIAVKSIEEALPYYENVLGLKCYNIETVEDPESGRCKDRIVGTYFSRKHNCQVHRKEQR